MTEQITLTVEHETKERLNGLAQRRGITLDELIREMFAAFEFHDRFVTPFQSLHSSMVDQAITRGILSEDDVFGQVS